MNLCHRCHRLVLHKLVMHEGHVFHAGCLKYYRCWRKERSKCECGYEFKPEDDKLFSKAGGQRICARCFRCEAVNAASEEYNARLRRLKDKIGRYIDPYTLSLPRHRL